LIPSNFNGAHAIRVGRYLERILSLFFFNPQFHSQDLSPCLCNHPPFAPGLSANPSFVGTRSHSNFRTRSASPYLITRGLKSIPDGYGENSLKATHTTLQRPFPRAPQDAIRASRSKNPILSTTHRHDRQSRFQNESTPRQCHILWDIWSSNCL
jgi:hypothetical protein